MKKLIALVIVCIMCLMVTSCGSGGVILDENEVISGNGTDKVEKAGVTYVLENGKVKKDGTVLYEFDNLINEKLFALGEYLYVNTIDGAMQLGINKDKITKFGTGEIWAAKGKWVYYTSDNSQVRGMSLYKVDMTEGRIVLLYEDDVVSCEEIENGVFLFTSSEGTEYVNEVNSDEAFYYEEWATEDVTEIETE